MTDLRMRLPRMKEWSRHGYFDPTRSNIGRSSNIYVNKTDDRYNGFCVQEYIGQGSHKNRLLWLGLSKCEITLEVSQFEVEVIVSWSASVHDWYKKRKFHRKNCYLHRIQEPQYHWQRKHQIERIEDRQHRKGLLPSRSFAISIEDTWRIFRNRILDRGIVGLL